MEEFNLDEFASHCSSYEIKIVWHVGKDKSEKFNAPKVIFQTLSQLENFRGMEVLKHGK